MNRYIDSLEMVLGYGYGYWVGWIIGFLIFGMIIVVIVKILIQNYKLRQSGKKLPLDALKSKYARNEITKAEFEYKKRLLKRR